MEVVRIFMTIAVYFISLISAVRSGILSGIVDVAAMPYCYFKECCTDSYIPADFTLLNKLLTQNLYGQDLAHQTVLYALRSHVNTKEPEKALAMSFHGLPGTGKNYVADFIVKALYKKDKKSNYVHWYNGYLPFRSEGLVEQYKVELQNSITENLKACPRSIFIFNEVDKIPNGTLDALVPFLDYHSTVPDIDTTKAIFIFLSNTGGTEIADYLNEMWLEKKTRNQAKLQDLEHLLAITAFNEKGGFHKNDAIESSLIDFYVPFLPLEEEHVRKCIIDAFQKRNTTPSNAQIEEAKSYLTFGLSPDNRYSTSGCKSLNQKVGSIIRGDLYNEEGIFREPDLTNDQSTEGTDTPNAAPSRTMEEKHDDTKDQITQRTDPPNTAVSSTMEEKHDDTKKRSTEETDKPNTAPSKAMEEKIDKVQALMESMTKTMEMLGSMVKENIQEVSNIRSDLVTHKKEVDALKSQFQYATKRETVEMDEL